MLSRSVTSAATIGLALLAFSCSSSTYREVYPILNDGDYDSEFPYRGCSAQLEEISQTVMMVSCIAYYKSFPFPREMQVRLEGVTDALLAARDRSSFFYTSTSSGTATVIASDRRRVLLLSCAHVVAFDDTVVSYHRDAEGKPTPYIRNIAFKNRQLSYVATLPEGGEVEILAVDHQADLALIGRQFSVELPSPIPEFAYPLGEARDLFWGSFVYMFGYPSGNKMVTKGIVSSPNKGGKGGFLVDALFNRGFSGGIALAIRDGVPNFELVGVVRAVSGRSSYVLAPRPEADPQEYDPTVPYSGDIYVEKRTEIESGIVQAIPVEAIRTFVEANAQKLGRGGYTVGQFLLRARPPARRSQ
jgi:hypothetical protein